MRRIRDEIRQIFTDTAHWNENVRKPHEAIIDPDPDGMMAKIEASYTDALKREEA